MPHSKISPPGTQNPRSLRGGAFAHALESLVPAKVKADSSPASRDRNDDPPPRRDAQTAEDPGYPIVWSPGGARNFSPCLGRSVADSSSPSGQLMFTTAEVERLHVLRVFFSLKESAFEEIGPSRTTVQWLRSTCPWSFLFPFAAIIPPVNAFLPSRENAEAR